MNVDIAIALGEILAIQTEELNKDPYDVEVLQRIRLISEVYGNFVGEGFSGFKEDFESGYQRVQKDVRLDQGAFSPDSERSSLQGGPSLPDP